VAVTQAQVPSTRPYLIRAIHEWCTDHGLTPYLAVRVDHTVRVPMEHVHNGEIVLNVSFDATSGLKLGNDWVEFKARFSGQAREICVPVDHVLAIYARENGQGMAFAMEPVSATQEQACTQPLAEDASMPPAGEKVIKLVSLDDDDPPPEPPGSTPPKTSARPALKLVK
jgi:stringent starvation protein B